MTPTNLRWSIFSVLLGALMGLLLLVQTWGDRLPGPQAVSAAAPVETFETPQFPPVTAIYLTEAERARAVIFKAAERNGIAPRAWQLQNVAWRESRLNPYAFNAKSGAMGLFQFKPATWRFAIGKMGRLHLNPWRMEDNAEAAAWMWAHGYADHWGMEP